MKLYYIDNDNKNDLKIIKRKFKKLKKLIIVENKINLGVAKSRNIGLSNQMENILLF